MCWRRRAMPDCVLYGSTWPGTRSPRMHSKDKTDYRNHSTRQQLILAIRRPGSYCFIFHVFARSLVSVRSKPRRHSNRQDGRHVHRSALCIADRFRVHNARASSSKMRCNKVNVWYLGQVEVVQEVDELAVARWTEVCAGFLLQRQPHRVLVGQWRYGCIMDA